MPKRAVHAEGGAVSISTDVKSEDTEITDTEVLSRHWYILAEILSMLCRQQNFCYIKAA